MIVVSQGFIFFKITRQPAPSSVVRREAREILPSALPAYSQQQSKQL